MNREEEIRKIAYTMWDLEGRPEGKSLEYWLAAETIWEINHQTEARAINLKDIPNSVSAERGNER